MPLRKVKARGYYNRRVWQPGEEPDVPDGFKASWLEDEPDAPKKRGRPPKAKEPEATNEADESDDDAG